MLLLHLPQALQTAEQVAAPQQDAAAVKMPPALGRASSGIESRAPMLSVMMVFVVVDDETTTMSMSSPESPPVELPEITHTSSDLPLPRLLASISTAICAPI